MEKKRTHSNLGPENEWLPHHWLTGCRKKFVLHLFPLSLDRQLNSTEAWVETWVKQHQGMHDSHSNFLSPSFPPLMFFVSFMFPFRCLPQSRVSLSSCLSHEITPFNSNLYCMPISLFVDMKLGSRLEFGWHWRQEDERERRMVTHGLRHWVFCFSRFPCFFYSLLCMFHTRLAHCSSPTSHHGFIIVTFAFLSWMTWMPWEDDERNKRNRENVMKFHGWDKKSSALILFCLRVRVSFFSLVSSSYHLFPFFPQLSHWISRIVSMSLYLFSLTDIYLSFFRIELQ